jgi:hypothetical protein
MEKHAKTTRIIKYLKIINYKIKKKIIFNILLFDAPGRTRTCNLVVRSHTRCPIAPRGQ